MFVLFNTNKEFIGYSPDIPDSSSILKKKISEDQSDIMRWKWVGTYDNGQMEMITDGYPIEEIEIEKKVFEYINKKYPLEVQLCNIIKQLNNIIQKDDSLQDDDFSDMAQYILNALEKREKRINYYRNYARLIPKHEAERHFNSAFGN